MKNFYRLIQGDCLKVLPTLANESMDLVITDPPYGLGFMGKDWDKAVPPIVVWKECLRVLKSGAFAFIMSSPRLDCLGQMSLNLQKAGFNVGFTPIYWAYASGFPKGENVSLTIDKRECMRQLEGKLGRNPTKEEFNESWRVFRDHIGKKSAGWHKSNLINDDGWKGERDERTVSLTEPRTQEAKALVGSYGGFQPKPSVEVIIVAMKPLSEKSYVDQALKNQKGITWLDDCRVPFQNKADCSLTEKKNAHSDFGSGVRDNDIFGVDNRPRSEQGNYTSDKGRFPANLLVSDDMLNDGKITKSNGHFNPEVKMVGHTLYEGGFKDFKQEDRTLDDSGSFSRFFDLDAWWVERVKTLPKSVQRTFPFLIVPKASKSERDEGLDSFQEVIRSGLPLRDGSGDYVENIGGDGSKSTRRTKARNIHPTVKPLKLMSYLITLGSREGDIVLDPFVGSGTTLIASYFMGTSCIGIDIEPEYCKIADAKTRFYCNQYKLDREADYRFEVLKE